MYLIDKLKIIYNFNKINIIRLLWSCVCTTVIQKYLKEVFYRNSNLFINYEIIRYKYLLLEIIG